MPNPALVPKRPEYYIQTGSMFENPDGVVAQVVFGKYVESSGLVFTGELIQQMIDRSLPRITGDRYKDEDAWKRGRLLRQRERDRPGSVTWATQYAGGVDLARQT